MHAQVRTALHSFSLSPSLLLGLLLAAPALGACVEVPEDAQPDELRSTTLADQACSEERRIAFVAGVTCPVVAQWDAYRLFPGAVGELAHYCVYKYAGNPGALNLTPIDSATLDHSPDCFVVMPEADPMATAINPTLQDAFFGAINRPSELDLDLANTGSLRSPVSVAVVDTVPDPSVVDPNSPHGVSMTDYIADIACPGGGVCPVAIDNLLGMPRVTGRAVDLVKGGTHGSQGDLASALWEASSSAPANQPAVISLSLGWEGDYFGAQQGDSVAVDAVYAAIERARCDGQLIVAAAGNEGHLCTSGPLHPAAWEQDAAPSPARCLELGSAPLPASNAYQPLVYAVGGLDYAGQPMPNARSAGMPRLAATGLHAVPSELAPTTALSGSSVSSAVVAGAASLIWSYYPNLAADQVMSIIYQAGSDLGTPADFVGPGAPAQNPVHEVDVCAAMSSARQHAATVPFAAPFGCLSQVPVMPAAVFPIVDLLPNATRTFAFDPVPVACSEGCDAGDGYLASGATGACPVDLDPALPFTTPQPDLPACPSCTIDPGLAEIHASIDPMYAGLTITDVLVTVFDGTTPTYFGLGAVPLSSSVVTQLNLSPALMPPNVDSATITISFDSPKMPRPNASDLIMP